VLLLQSDHRPLGCSSIFELELSKEDLAWILRSNASLITNKLGKENSRSNWLGKLLNNWWLNNIFELADQVHWCLLRISNLDHWVLSWASLSFTLLTEVIVLPKCALVSDSNDWLITNVTEDIRVYN
jgi:hypothetical protein